MVMLRPGEEAVVGAGERLVLQVSRAHAASVALELSAADRARLDKRHGAWALQVEPGSSASVVIVSADGAPMSGRLAVTLSVRGGAAPVDSWELSDIQVTGRVRIDLLDVVRERSGEWRVRSRQFSVIDEPILPGPAEHPGPGIQGDPLEVHLAVALDRSASMAWAYQGRVLVEVIGAIQSARRLALTPRSRVQWLSYGSRSDATDGPRAVDGSGMAPDEIVRHLRPAVHSSGSRLATVTPLLGSASLLLAVTDSWPDEEILAAWGSPPRGPAGEPAPALAVVLLGLPADPAGWPIDWIEGERRCREAGIPLLCVAQGDASSAVRDWLLAQLVSSGDATARRVSRAPAATGAPRRDGGRA